ncbi:MULTISPECIES: ATP-binding protein [Streptomyces]|uniref:PrsL n=1 Tax=Streptomyces viridosporus (strain ATCC 14672 / DSM 40746 / JCM 4963 / KCTC 9882 / NRRL B-12104 / FH 1290) TaxID=566461 RepID=D5ZWY8_STRV1|nr:MULTISPECIES: ATP-binding protein [Streptomyces]EFE65098.1 PrsL [Streptomyces viridosporus ATCC 14672]
MGGIRDVGLDGASAGRAPAGARPEGCSVRFERGAFRIADARHLAAEYLAMPGDGRARALSDSVVQAVQLVVSELVTNAVKYGSGPVELSLVLEADVVIVTVRDGDTTLPSPRPANPDRVGQHGLEIVLALCQDVDIRREPAGKRITARIAAHC